MTCDVLSRSVEFHDQTGLIMHNHRIMRGAHGSGQAAFAFGQGLLALAQAAGLIG